MRLLLTCALLLGPAAGYAQSRAPSPADSELVGRILLAEDRRDSADPALAEGAAHSDSRIRTLALRARGRIRDSLFSARDSLPPLPDPSSWPEPAWRLRYRALRANQCAALRAGLGDADWRVKLRAADLLTPACAADDSAVTILSGWIAALPRDVSSRAPGSVSWHGAAHALVALARLRPEDTRARLLPFATHNEWHLRLYAARAAGIAADTTTLRLLGRDPDDNVKEAAIDALSRLTGHGDDVLYLEALESEGAQAVRAAAIALKGSPRRDLESTITLYYERWVARKIASARDARLALLDAIGRPAGEDRPPPIQNELPPDAVALALGKPVRLRVTMASGSGGGAFVVLLRGDNAPIMAARILALARAGYYDTGTWHRVEADFVIQGGGHGDNEYVGNAQFLRDELGTVPHRRGTVGMSTRGHDTGDAQWFINLKDNLRLGRDYTVFAEVVDGIDVVDGILEGDVIESIREVSVPRR